MSSPYLSPLWLLVWVIVIIIIIVILLKVVFAVFAIGGIDLVMPAHMIVSSPVPPLLV